MYELKNSVRCSGYDESSNYTHQLAVGDDIDHLRERWNAHVEGEVEKLKDPRDRDRHLARLMPAGDTTAYYTGGTGGGWSCVTNNISITKIKQFDEG